MTFLLANTQKQEVTIATNGYNKYEQVDFGICFFS
jgi:hypothetical protein